jgi:3-phenylpropionate/cinnamic acid dioxygenase small subunit
MSAGTWESHHAITTLMYRYVEYVDAADFDGIASLFADGRITNEGVNGAVVGPDAVRALYENTNRVHADGTLRTRHLTANVMVDIDEAAGSASARSAFIVFQQTTELPLQPIVAGRYRDTFTRSGDTTGADWRFECRHIIVDQVGDVREHLKFDLSSFIEKG